MARPGSERMSDSALFRQSTPPHLPPSPIAVGAPTLIAQISRALSLSNSRGGDPSPFLPLFQLWVSSRALLTPKLRNDGVRSYKSALRSFDRQPPLLLLQSPLIPSFAYMHFLPILLSGGGLLHVGILGFATTTNLIKQGSTFFPDQNTYLFLLSGCLRLASHRLLPVI